MTEYDKTYKNVKVLFTIEQGRMTLGETLSNAGFSQLRMAETEKYPHVTYFFSGGREEQFKNEQRIVIPSPKVATYDLQPEMSAPELTRAAIRNIEQQQYDFIVINFANPDMVGHTGDFEAVVKAVEFVDESCRQVVENALANGYICLVTSDHGNAEYLVNNDGTPNTSHTVNPVPLFVLHPDKKQLKLTPTGKLGNIAPTILQLMGVEQPKEMTEHGLIKL